MLWDLLQSSCVEISYRHLVQIALQRDLAQWLRQRTCQGDLAHDLLQSSPLKQIISLDSGMILWVCLKIRNLQTQGRFASWVLSYGSVRAQHLATPAAEQRKGQPIHFPVTVTVDACVLADRWAEPAECVVRCG